MQTHAVKLANEMLEWVGLHTQLKAQGRASMSLSVSALQSPSLQLGQSTLSATNNTRTADLPGLAMLES